jgi:hypothetical protein
MLAVVVEIVQQKHKKNKKDNTKTTEYKKQQNLRKMEVVINPLNFSP